MTDALTCTEVRQLSTSETYEKLIHPSLLHCLKKSKFKELRDVQRFILSVASLKNDIIIKAPTGTGKTLCFLLLALSKVLYDIDNHSVQVENVYSNTAWRHILRLIILCPTKELCSQILAVTHMLCEELKHKLNAFVVTEKINTISQIIPNIKGNILICTPATIQAMVKSLTVNLAPKELASCSVLLPNVSAIVIDEADLVLSTYGFQDDVNFLFSPYTKNNVSVFPSNQVISNKFMVILTCATFNDSLNNLCLIALYKPILALFLFKNETMEQVTKLWPKKLISTTECFYYTANTNLLDYIRCRFVVSDKCEIFTTSIIYYLLSQKIRSYFSKKILVFVSNDKTLAKLHISLKALGVSSNMISPSFKNTAQFEAISNFNNNKTNVLLMCYNEEFTSSLFDDSEKVVPQDNKKKLVSKKGSVKFAPRLNRGIDFTKLNYLIVHDVSLKTQEFDHQVGRLVRNYSIKTQPTCLVVLNSLNLLPDAWPEIHNKYQFKEGDEIIQDAHVQYYYRVTDAQKKASRAQIKNLLKTYIQNN